ncbi:type IV pilus modification PilV family protein [Eggerthella timonensis]|uniref:type IV pilus modification PilV family protein n=1 Tax=Eggerthella timonensis TaxID=1871008 RepID=UPI000C78EAC9|nr:hypothetical protein [Eggerthella timonensis]
MAKLSPGTLLTGRRGSDTTWHGTAFVVEALVLLVFLAFALATFMQLFGAAHARGVEERVLTQAVSLASNNAERFAAAPESGSMTETFDAEGARANGSEGGEDAYLVSRDVASERSAAGTLYRATINVEHDGDVVYTIDTARYVSDDATKEGGAA